MRRTLAAIERHLRAGSFPGCAALAVDAAGRRLIACHAGNRSLVPRTHPITEDTVFDLASVTKPLAAAAVAMSLREAGRVDLDEPFTTGAGLTTSLRALLTHTSGLPDYLPFYLWPAAPDILGLAWHAPPVREPGGQPVYSDVGFMVVQRRLERATGRPFSDLYRELVSDRFPPGSTPFFPTATDGAGLLRYAATERCVWRGRVLHGEVHDFNAWAMGGVAAHAGLFGTAGQVATVAAHLLGLWTGEIAAGAWQPESVRLFLTPAAGGRTLGWDTPTPGGSSSGGRFSPRSVGHLGYTGTSLWIDPERGLAAVLLTNAVHPAGTNRGMKTARPEIHDAIADDLEEAIG